MGGRYISLSQPAPFCILQKVRKLKIGMWIWNCLASKKTSKIFKAKPARKVVKIRPLKKVKDMVA